MDDASKKIILIVDDEEELREITGFEIESLGFACVYAGSGREALQIWQNDARIEAIISDIKMVNGDGIKLARAIRDAKSGREPYIILVSGFVEQGLAQEVADCVLEKPINFDELATLLKDRLQGGCRP